MSMMGIFMVVLMLTVTVTSQCSTPANLENGYAQCEDTSYPYTSVCTWKCNDGYRLQGNLYIQCEADGQWTSSDQPTCIDDIAPTLECITPQTFYADRGRSSTNVTWQPPTVNDNLDTAPTLNKTEGPAIGSTLEFGRIIVKYKASDSAGNESPECTVELRVEEIKCSHPLDTLNDNNMAFNCTGVTYSYGDTCTLTCNYNLPLDGENIITCEKEGSDDNPTGVWDWGTGHQPICEEIECPELNRPLNGGLVENSFSHRPIMTIMCNENFDIPELSTTIAFSGLYLCNDDGTWGPISYVPDCTEQRNPRFISLPSEIYYFSGDCNTEQIRQNFQTILNSTLAQICPAGETCHVGEMTIRCGPTNGRHPETMWMYIGIGIAGIALMLSFVAIAIVCFKKQGKWPFRSNSVSSVNNFRPRTGPSNTAILPSQVTGASTTGTTFYHANKSTKPDILTMDDVENTYWTPSSGSPPPPYCDGDGNMSLNGVATP